MKTMFPPSYHHNGFVATHALGHMMYGYIYICEHICIYMKLYVFMKLYVLINYIYVLYEHIYIYIYIYI